MAGYLASNIAKNVQIPHGVRIMFQKTGQTNWIDFGDLSDVSVTPLAEFFEHFSNHDGKNALAKRILTNRGVTIEATLNEVAPENLRLAFLGDASAAAAAKKVVVVDVIDGTVVDATESDYFLTNSIAAATDILSVVEPDGSTIVGTLPTITAGAVGTAKINLDFTSGSPPSQVHVTYETSIQMQSFNLLADSDVSGKLQFQIRNMEGGLAQVVELLSVTIAPTGALTVPVDAVQSIPLTITAQVVNGEFGKVYYADVA